MWIPAPKTPQYELVLPVSKQKVKYRPFLVKEEKILLMANEEKESGHPDIKNAIIQVCDACTFNKLDMANLPVADMEYLFMNIRMKSVSESLDTVVTCPACSNNIEYTVDLNKAEVFNEIKSYIVDLGEGTLLTLRAPVMSGLDGIKDIDPIDIPDYLISNIIESITIDEQVFDMNDFTKTEVVAWIGALSHSQADTLNSFIDKLPRLMYVDKIKCTCGQDITVKMEGLEDFFGG